LTPDEFALQWMTASLSEKQSMTVHQPDQGNPDGLRFAPALTRLLPGQKISFQESKAEKGMISYTESGEEWGQVRLRGSFNVVRSRVER